MINNDIAQKIMNISLIDMERYLVKKGWKLIDHPNKKIHLFRGPLSDNDAPIDIMLPINIDFLDYKQRIKDIINMLSILEQKTSNDFIDELTLISNDRMRMRVISSVSDSSSLPLDIAAHEVQGLKNLYMWAACSEEKKAPHFDQPSTLAINHVRNCRFGHTFEGSFGFIVSSPIISEYDQLPLFDHIIEAPFERKVTERIARGFSLTKKALLENDPLILIDNFPIAFNSKMCDAILDMSVEKQNKIKFFIDWSYQIPVEKELQFNEYINFDLPEFELIEYASSELQKIEPFKDTIIGKIITLHTITDPQLVNEIPRIAIIKHNYGGHSIDVKLELTREQYLSAYTAHGKGQKVKIIGNLFKKGSIWRMVDIESIELF